MIKTVLLLLIGVCSLFAQPDSTETTGVKRVLLKYYDYQFTIGSNDKAWFTGHLEVIKDGKVEFRMDSTFSEYITHDIIDMDGDGSKEMLLSLSEGASPYIYNALYVFDIKTGIKPLYVLMNADLDTTKKGEPKISGYSRMSPSVLGLGYNWLWEYKYGKLKFFKAKGKPWKSLVTPDEKGLYENLTQYEDFDEKCSDGVYNTFFESLFIQYKIAGDNSSALRFFNKYYKCPEKMTALKQIQNAANDTYSWLNDESNFRYIEE
jgi:hypothetical protein